MRASGRNDASVVLDPDGERHWQARTRTRSGWLEFELPAPVTFDVVRLEEAIAHGQHIANHRVDAWREREWLKTARYQPQISAERARLPGNKQNHDSLGIQQDAASVLPAMIKEGEVGAYALHIGFVYAVCDADKQDALLASKSVYTSEQK